MFARQLLFNLCVLLFLVLLVKPQLDPFNRNLFVSLWDEISQLVTPRFPDFTSYEKPPELYLMNMPGFAIVPNDYNETYWRSNNYEATDPELLLASLVDSIPAVAPYYVDSGRRVSVMYKKFIQNYYTKRNLTANNDVAYQKALEKIFTKDSWTPSTLASTVNQTREIVRETFSRLAELRRVCLQNEPFSCSRKAVYWQEELDDQNLMYMVAHRELMGSQSQVLALQTKNIDNIVTAAMQKVISNQRSSVGLKSFLGDYLTTRFDPSDFWCWFQNTRDCKSDSSAFSDVSINIKTSSVASSSAYTKAAFKAAAEYQKPLFGVKGVISTAASSQQNFDATASGSNIQMTFQLAQVKVFREWFDASIFDLYPLGVNNVKYSSWSDGNYEGIFPWFITKLVVAREISITMDSWTADILTVINQVNTTTALKANYGPFVFTGATAQKNSTAPDPTNFSFTGKTLTIKGPQIIGYVTTKLPLFPNYESADGL